MTLRRREVLRMALAGGTWLAAGLLPGAAASQPGYPESGPGLPNGRAEGGTPSPYGGLYDPPAGLDRHSLDAVTRPPPFEADAPGRRRALEIWASEQPVRVARGQTFSAWTYNGSVPGPLLRATQGDQLDIRFRNFGVHPHNLHFHGRHAVSQDGWEPVAPGSEERYRIRAEPHGLFPYHCHAKPVSQHVARGLYGALIVDPPGGRPPAHEFVLVLCGFDLSGDGRNDVYAWNGVAGYYARFPIKVPVGELVRLYLVNMVNGDPVASFHLHAETFDVYRSGTRLTPDEHTDVVSFAQTQRAIVEFRLPAKGRYMFHPHQIHMAERGAMGWFSAI